MSNHPTIAALMAALEIERLEEQKQWANATFPPLNIETTKDFTQDVNFARREVHALAYKAGHKAATNRLLPLLERAIKMAEFYTKEKLWYPYDGYLENGSPALDDSGDKAREFLAELEKELK